jgi:protocatechuate 3,4-dioxygenase alpha subunit
MLTPLQPTGPYPEAMLDLPRGTAVAAGPDTAGTRVVIEGRLVDGAGAPVADALVEIWQGDAEGRYHHERDPRHLAADPGFWGYARVATEDSGRFQFDTIKPGVVEETGSRAQAPHILVSICGTGILTRYLTRVYFEDEAANASDPILQLVPAARRGTLIAQPLAAKGSYQFDIVLQDSPGGRPETVFFDV